MSVFLSEIIENELITSMVSVNIERTNQLIQRFKNVVTQRFDIDGIEKIFNALELELTLHGSQVDRPSGLPYISHPLEVALDLVELYGVSDVDEVCAALLHDSVEDQFLKLYARKVRKDFPELFHSICIENFDEWKEINKIRIMGIALDEIQQVFGNKVAHLVFRLTNPDFNSLVLFHAESGKVLSKNQLYKEHVKELEDEPPAFRIKFIDFYKNALSLHAIPDGEKKTKLINKYGPVILEIFIPFFKKIESVPNENYLSLSSLNFSEKLLAYYENYYFTFK